MFLKNQPHIVILIRIIIRIIQVFRESFFRTDNDLIDRFRHKSILYHKNRARTTENKLKNNRIVIRMKMIDKYTVSFFLHKEGDYVLPHHHDKFEIIYYTSGKGTTIIGDEQFKYRQDNLIVIPPNVRHDEYAIEPTGVMYCSVDNSYALTDKPVKIALDENNAEKMQAVKSAMQTMIGVKRNADGGDDNQSALKIVGVIMQLLQEKNGNHKDETKKLIEFAKTYILKNFNYRINYVLLAEKIGYSYDRFRHLFHDFYGQTIKEYELLLKFSYARSLLIESNEPIGKIAIRCGFKTANAFCNWFQREMGITALQYRKIVSKKWFYGICNISQRNDYMKNLIIDTDLGCDCDDAGALALAHLFYNFNIANILCETHCINDESGCKLIDEINAYYGKKFETGIALQSKINPEEYFGKFVYKIVGKSDGCTKYESADKVTSKALEAAEDGSVTLIYIGQLNNLASLLRQHYPLVKQKAEKIVVMGGCFAEYDEFYRHNNYSFRGEFNIATDVKSAKEAVSYTDLKIDFVDYTCGANVLTGKAFSRLENNIVKDIYRLNTTEMRASWDLVAVLYAMEFKKDFFRVSDYGKVEITDTGKTLFKIGGGKHRYVSLNVDETEISDFLEKILQLNIRQKIDTNKEIL